MAMVEVRDGEVSGIRVTGAGYGSGNVWTEWAKLEEDGYWRASVRCLVPAEVGYQGGMKNFKVRAGKVEAIASALAEKVGADFEFVFLPDDSEVSYC